MKLSDRIRSASNSGSMWKSCAWGSELRMAELRRCSKSLSEELRSVLGGYGQSAW